MPETLRGKSKVLYIKVLNDPSLWTVPQASVGDHEAGVVDTEWHINAAALSKAWPRLVSSRFLC